MRHFFCELGVFIVCVVISILTIASEDDVITVKYIGLVLWNALAILGSIGLSLTFLVSILSCIRKMIEEKNDSST